MTKPQYTYLGIPVSVHDGDTATFDLIADPVDIGFGVKLNGSSRQVCRFLGYNARELGTPGAVEARDRLAALLSARPLKVVSVQVDKYGGRFDGVVYLPDGSSVADVMIREGYGAPWDGKGPAPVPPWPPSVR